MTLCNRRSVITKEEINTAYFRLVVQYTPELNPEKIHLIRNAYETLTDPKARLNYDAQLASLPEAGTTLMVDDRTYEVLLIDDPMGLHEHLEVYLRAVG